MFVAIREHKKEDKEAESKLRLRGNKSTIIVKNEFCTATLDYEYVIQDLEAIQDENFASFKIGGLSNLSDFQ